MPRRIAPLLAPLLPLLTLALAAPAARAGGALHLAWNSCAGDGGASNQDFACDTNAQAFTLVGSFVPDGSGPFPITGGWAGIFVFGQDSAALPWWTSFGASACRATAIAANTTIPPAALSCDDAWAGAPGSATVTGIAPYASAAENIIVSMSLPAGETRTLTPGVEYFAFNLQINASQTTGSGACGGCGATVCIHWAQLALHVSPYAANPLGGDMYLGGGDGSIVTWQASDGYVCSHVTPARNRTWGAIKSLYR